MSLECIWTYRVISSTLLACDSEYPDLPWNGRFVKKLLWSLKGSSGSWKAFLGPWKETESFAEDEWATDYNFEHSTALTVITPRYESPQLLCWLWLAVGIPVCCELLHRVASWNLWIFDKWLHRGVGGSKGGARECFEAWSFQGTAVDGVWPQFLPLLCRIPDFTNSRSRRKIQTSHKTGVKTTVTGLEPIFSDPKSDALPLSYTASWYGLLWDAA